MSNDCENEEANAVESISLSNENTKVVSKKELKNVAEAVTRKNIDKIARKVEVTLNKAKIGKLNYVK